MCAAPQAKAGPEPIVVLVSGLHPADLGEGARAKDTVAVSEGNTAVKVARLADRVEPRRQRRFVAEFSAEVPKFREELGRDGRAGAEPDVELLELIVVDQIELDIFVA